MIAPDADLRSQIARAIHRYDYEHGLSGNDIPREHHRGEATAVLAVLDRHVEQLTARIAELEKQVTEDAEYYAELANHNEATCEAVQRRDAAEAALARVREYLETSDDDGIRTRETVLRFLDAAEQATWEAS